MNANVPSASSYQPGTVSKGIAGILSQQSTDIGQWGSDLRQTGLTGGGPNVVKIGGASPLDHQSTNIGDRADQIFTGSPTEALKGVFGAAFDTVSLLTGTGFGMLAHDIGNAYVNHLQDAFINRHPTALAKMDSLMSNASDALGRLSDLADAYPRPPTDYSDILQKKRTVGDDAGNSINDALANAKPEDREALQSLADDANAWKTSRDGQIAAEAPDVDALDVKAHKVYDEVSRQSGQLRQAADLTWQARSSDSQNLIHTTPQAGLFAAGIQQFLLGTRARLTGAEQSGTPTS